jgi:hypothetical protein
LSEPIGRSLVPPRKNLGPEPWPERRPLQSAWVIVAILTLSVAVWLLGRMVRRRLARSRPGQATPAVVDVTPRGRLVGLSTSTKNALATRFGSTWRAKTTEELADEPPLRDVLGPEMLTQLIEFLDRIDRLKFAPERPSKNRQSLEDELAAWDPRVAGLIARIEARANGRHERQASRVNSDSSQRR